MFWGTDGIVWINISSGLRNIEHNILKMPLKVGACSFASFSKFNFDMGMNYLQKYIDD